MASDRDRIVVHLDAGDLGPRREVGTLARESGAGRSVVSFAYRSEWIAAADSFQIDPALPLFEGEQYPPALPGILADAAPDRWGRTLLERREAHLARREDRERRHLEDWDFLVGVDDRTRMGALRLTSGVEGAETFLAAGSLLDTARYYRLSTEEAGEIVDQVSHAVAGWPELARQAELRGDEVERIGAAFVSA